LKGGDRKTLEACDFTVVNTVVDNFSLFKRTYEPAVHVDGIGMLISHNRFQNSSSSALRVDGGDITVEFCQCFDLVKESDDQGGSDSYFNYTFRRQLFRYNHWRDIKGGMFAGAGGIRFDDIISGEVVYGNIFERCGGGQANFGGVQFNGGRDNLVANNIFYDCPFAISGSAAQGDDWRQKIDSNLDRINAVDGFSPAYEMKYPEMLSSYYRDEGWNYVHNNIVVNAVALSTNPSVLICKNNTEISGDNKGLSYYLKTSVQQEAGLTPIPFEEIGVVTNRFVK